MAYSWIASLAGLRGWCCAGLANLSSRTRTRAASREAPSLAHLATEHGTSKQQAPEIGMRVGRGRGGLFKVMASYSIVVVVHKCRRGPFICRADGS